MALLTGQAGTADPIDEEYFTRESADDSVAIHMHLDAMDGIARDVVEGLRSLPGRGVEVGGLLLGHVEPGERPRVWIERYQRLACEHRIGPRFVLDEDERAGLERAATAIHQSSALNVVGFYRSHAHAGLELEESDFELISRYFSDPGDVILVVAAESVAGISAQFFARGASGEVHASGAEFPFRGKVVGSLAGNLPGEAAAEASAGQAPVVAEAESGRPAPREGFRRLVPDFAPFEDPGRPPRAFMNAAGLEGQKTPAAALPAPFPKREDTEALSTQRLLRQRWPLVCAILLVAGAAGLLLPRAGRRAAAPVSGSASIEPGAPVRPLGLYADPSGPTWRISWNRGATALSGARAVRLFVRDGDDQNRIDLSPQDLQSGTYPYQPKGLDVAFRLEVTDSGGRVTAESFRVLKSEPPAPVKPAAPASDAVPPHATRQIPPTVPASIRPRIRDPIPIDVWVRVDIHGRVIDAVPATKQHSGLETYLAKRAVAAAKLWRFDPARKDGKPVPGREKIHFVFER